MRKTGRIYAYKYKEISSKWLENNETLNIMNSDLSSSAEKPERGAAALGRYLPL